MDEHVIHVARSERRSLLRGFALALALLVGLAQLGQAYAQDSSPVTEVGVELPPPDLPSGNQEGYVYDFNMILTADLNNVTKEAPVYVLERRQPTQNEVKRLADRLGIDAEVVEQSPGVFVADNNGTLTVSSDITQFLSNDPPEDGDLPEDSDAIAAATDWLRTAKLTPAELGEGDVISKSNDAGRMVVVFKPSEPGNVIAGYPSVTISVGPKLAILDAQVLWPQVTRGDIYQLRASGEAWQDIKDGKAYLEVDLARAEIEPGAVVGGSIQFTSIDIAYTTAGAPGGDQYLQPVFLFEGSLKVKGVKDPFPIRAYVPALANSGAPVG